MAPASAADVTSKGKIYIVLMDPQFPTFCLLRRSATND